MSTVTMLRNWSKLRHIKRKHYTGKLELRAALGENQQFQQKLLRKIYIFKSYKTVESVEWLPDSAAVERNKQKTTIKLYLWHNERVDLAKRHREKRRELENGGKGAGGRKLLARWWRKRFTFFFVSSLTFKDALWLFQSPGIRDQNSGLECVFSMPSCLRQISLQIMENHLFSLRSNSAHIWAQVQLHGALVLSIPFYVQWVSFFLSTTNRRIKF